MLKLQALRAQLGNTEPTDESEQQETDGLGEATESYETGELEE